MVDESRYEVYSPLRVVSRDNRHYMSFLDNLENNLNALERNEQGGLEDVGRRDSWKNDEIAAAPWAEKLKTADWTKDLMRLATAAGHQRRMRIGLVWIKTSLRLEGLNQRLDLRPTAKGIDAVFLSGTEEVKRLKLDLTGDAGKLLNQWLPLVDAQKKVMAAESARLMAEIQGEIAE
jgi:hypothetical protein